MSHLWRLRSQPASAKASYRVVYRFNAEGVYYRAEPALDDWQNQWPLFGSDSPCLSLLNQFEELGYVIPFEGELFLTWDALYANLTNEESNTDDLLKLLKLPNITDYKPSLTSHGSLEDSDFRITLGDWVNSQGHRLLNPPTIDGAIITYQNQNWLLSESVWHLVREVRAFYAMHQKDRSPQKNRQSWSAIRRYACAAKVPMEDFLQRTVVLSPDQLILHLHQSAVSGAKTVQVEPDFDGAPPKWLETFDKFSSIPERYDIPDGQGIVQILITPQVRSILQEIRRWPGRYVSGQQAEAFIRNPYSALGEDAVAVIDET